MGIRTLYRLAVIGLGAALALGAVAGCGRPSGAGTGRNGPAPSDSPGFEGGFDVNHDGTPDAPGSPGNGGNGGNNPGGTTTPSAGKTTAPAGYPGDAKSYGLAVISAWVGRQTARLQDLSNTAGGYVSISNLQTNLNTHWTYAQCEGAAGSSYCTYRNDNGDGLTLQLTNEKLGHPQALSGAVLDKTAFPNNAGDYVSMFINAWQNGNRQRMLAYAGSGPVNALGSAQPPPNWQNHTITDKGGYTEVYGSALPAGNALTFKVNKSLGGPHGITAITM